MSVKLMGPNDNFVPKVLKDGAGKLKVGAEKKTNFESVNHEDFSGKQRLADTNPGSNRQNQPQYGKNPAQKEMRDGKEIPMKKRTEISAEEESNKPPRGFVYSREGHKIDNGPSSEGQ